MFHQLYFTAFTHKNTTFRRDDGGMDNKEVKNQLLCGVL